MATGNSKNAEAIWKLTLHLLETNVQKMQELPGELRLAEIILIYFDKFCASYIIFLSHFNKVRAGR